MRTTLKSFTLLFILISAGARAGHDVGGGGIAENNVMYAMQNLENFIPICLNSPNCNLTKTDSALLKSILDALPEEKKNPNLIVFKSEGAEPGFFIVDGQLRIAKTEYHVGATIYINVDLLYPPVAGVSIPLIPKPDKPLDIPTAVAVLVHELGHHQGERDHTYLDALGSKVQTVLRANVQELDGGPQHRALVADSLTFENYGLGDFIITDKKQLLSLGHQVAATLSCPDGQSLKAYELWNLHWLKSNQVEDGIELWPLRTRALLYCGSDIANSRIERELEISLYLKILQSGDFEIQGEKTFFRQIDCGITPQVCH